ncbi:hypothetical protein ACFL2H_05110 [Planctomycetota bacterium]
MAILAVWIKPYWRAWELKQEWASRGAILSLKQNGTSLWVIDRHKEFDVSSISEIPRLEIVCLRAVSDSDLEAIGSCHTIRTIRIENAEITSDGLKHLIGLKRLQTLCLLNTKIDDRRVSNISKMPCLKSLVLAGNAGLSPSGRRAIAQKIPDLEILDGT